MVVRMVAANCGHKDTFEGGTECRPWSKAKHRSLTGSLCALFPFEVDCQTGARLGWLRNVKFGVAYTRPGDNVHVFLLVPCHQLVSMLVQFVVACSLLEYQALFVEQFVELAVAKTVRLPAALSSNYQLSSGSISKAERLQPSKPSPSPTFVPNVLRKGRRHTCTSVQFVEMPLCDGRSHHRHCADGQGKKGAWCTVVGWVAPIWGADRYTCRTPHFHMHSHCAKYRRHVFFGSSLMFELRTQKRSFINASCFILRLAVH